jgi:hypothetical protein
MDDTVIIMKTPQNPAKKSTSNTFNKSEKPFENNFFFIACKPQIE